MRLNAQTAAAMSAESEKLNRFFQGMVEKNPRLSELFAVTREPSYRYWKFRQVMYCWTTETLDDGRYAAFIYKPYGRGSKSGKALNWKLAKERRFKNRKTAKAYALKWFHAAQAAAAKGD